MKMVPVNELFLLHRSGQEFSFYSGEKIRVLSNINMRRGGLVPAACDDYFIKRVSGYLSLQKISSKKFVQIIIIFTSISDVPSNIAKICSIRFQGAFGI